MNQRKASTPLAVFYVKTTSLSVNGISPQHFITTWSVVITCLFPKFWMFFNSYQNQKQIELDLVLRETPAGTLPAVSCNTSFSIQLSNFPYRKLSPHLRPLSRMSAQKSAVSNTRIRKAKMLLCRVRAECVYMVEISGWVLIRSGQNYQAVV